jgi:hypothetical protein
MKILIALLSIVTASYAVDASKFTLSLAAQDGEYSFNAFGLTAKDDVDGMIGEVGFDLNDSVSLVASYGTLEADSADIELDEIRATARFTLNESEINYVKFGIGYGDQSIDVAGLGTLDGEAILAELILGAKLSDSINAEVELTHAIATSVTSGFEKEDLTEVEFSFNYKFTDSVYAIASYRDQVRGDTLFENEGVFKLGLGMNF